MFALGVAATATLLIGSMTEHSDPTAVRPTACLDGPREPGQLSVKSCRTKVLYATDDESSANDGSLADDVSAAHTSGRDRDHANTAPDRESASARLTSASVHDPAGAVTDSYAAHSGLFAAMPMARPVSISAVMPDRHTGSDIYRGCDGVSAGSELGCRLDSTHSQGDDDVDDQKTRTISGRIMSIDGLAISGVAVVARPADPHDSGGTDGAGPVSEGTRPGAERYRTVSDSLGFYTFRRLPEGDYWIRTQDHGPYASVQTPVGSGTKYADLVLRNGADVAVEGRVLTVTGEPLAGVTVLPMMPGAASVLTNDYGKYRLPVAGQPDALNLKLRFQRPGFREAYLSVPTPRLSSADGKAPDAIMQPVDYWTAVNGTVATTDGAPLAHRPVELRPLGEQRTYRTETDLKGRFRFDAVEAPLAYRLHVSAGPAYKDFRDQLLVTIDEARVDIVVEPYEFRGFGDRQVGPDSAENPDFDLALRNRAANAINSAAKQRTAPDARANFQLARPGPGPQSLLVDAEEVTTVAPDNEASRQSHDVAARTN